MMNDNQRFHPAIRRRAATIFAVIFSVISIFARPAAAAEPQVTEGFINLATPEVWKLFTTSAGYQRIGVAQAEVDLKVGGTIRTHYDPKGRLGDANTIVNQILAYEPERMLALRLKQAPANFAHKDAIDTIWTVIYLNPAGEGMTQVRIVGLGYNDSPASQATAKFFAEANRSTLDHIANQYWPKCAKCVADEAAAAAQAASSQKK